jgi:hypothetical protein
MNKKKYFLFIVLFLMQNIMTMERSSAREQTLRLIKYNSSGLLNQFVIRNNFINFLGISAAIGISYLLKNFSNKIANGIKLSGNKIFDYLKLELHRDTIYKNCLHLSNFIFYIGTPTYFLSKIIYLSNKLEHNANFADFILCRNTIEIDKELIDKANNVHSNFHAYDILYRKSPNLVDILHDATFHNKFSPKIWIVFLIVAIIPLLIFYILKLPSIAYYLMLFFYMFILKKIKNYTKKNKGKKSLNNILEERFNCLSYKDYKTLDELIQKAINYTKREYIEDDEVQIIENKETSSTLELNIKNKLKDYYTEREERNNVSDEDLKRNILLTIQKIYYNQFIEIEKTISFIPFFLYNALQYICIILFSMPVLHYLKQYIEANGLVKFININTIISYINNNYLEKIIYYLYVWIIMNTDSIYLLTKMSFILIPFFCFCKLTNNILYKYYSIQNDKNILKIGILYELKKRTMNNQKEQINIINECGNINKIKTLEKMYYKIFEKSTNDFNIRH